MKQRFFRLLDLIFSFFGLWLLSPILLLIFLIGLKQPGGAIYKQDRLGRFGVPFTLFKFRTMAVNAPSVPTHQLPGNLVTPFGKILRQTKLDELPQLLNVLRGDMSLVGPRPGLPTQIELYQAREKHGVFSVRPGITGLSQLTGVDMSTPELLAKTDANMIAQMSVYKYFMYVILTAAGSGFGDRIKAD